MKDLHCRNRFVLSVLLVCNFFYCILAFFFSLFILYFDFKECYLQLFTVCSDCVSMEVCRVPPLKSTSHCCLSGRVKGLSCRNVFFLLLLFLQCIMLHSFLFMQLLFAILYLVIEISFFIILCRISYLLFEITRGDL